MKRRVSAWRQETRRRQQMATYERNGRRPWSSGYIPFRQQFIQDMLANESSLENFQKKDALPSHYGEFLDERVVEYPWLLSRLGKCSGRLLDAGSTLNYDFILRHPALAQMRVSIMTLAPESQCYWQDGISYLYDDLREMPWRDDVFDVVTCISTLEHIGMDNRMYTGGSGEGECYPDDYLAVVREMRRIVRPGGDIFITVPYGREANYGYFQQFTPTMISRLLDTLAPTAVDETYFSYRNGGWEFAEKDACAEAESFDIHQSKYFNPQSNRDYDPDFAACARAIAALRITL